MASFYSWKFSFCCIFKIGPLNKQVWEQKSLSLKQPAFPPSLLGSWQHRCSVQLVKSNVAGFAEFLGEDAGLSMFAILICWL